MDVKPYNSDITLTGFKFSYSVGMNKALVFSMKEETYHSERAGSVIGPVWMIFDCWVTQPRLMYDTWTLIMRLLLSLNAPYE